MPNPTATAEKATPVPATSTPRPRRVASLRFYVCVAVLGISAAGMQVAAKSLGAYFRPERVDLKRPLSALAWEKLAPQYRPHIAQPSPMDETQVQGIGTDEYVQARLVDTRRMWNDPARVANIFITYYTGQPDMVPHVPDECYLAGGYDALGSPASVEVPVEGAGAPGGRVPVRVVQFRSRQRDEVVTVLYFFHANGEYKATRDGVRLKLANPFERFAYYSKIEIKFTDDPEDARRAPRSADKSQSLEAVGPLLQKLMPILLTDHFAWERVNPGAGQPGAEKDRG